MYLVSYIFSRCVMDWLVADLGVTKSYSRPHVSDDNLFSGDNCKTLKYRRSFRSALPLSRRPASSC